MQTPVENRFSFLHTHPEKSWGPPCLYTGTSTTVHAAVLLPVFFTVVTTLFTPVGSVVNFTAISVGKSGKCIVFIFCLLVFMTCNVVPQLPPPSGCLRNVDGCFTVVYSAHAGGVLLTPCQSVSTALKNYIELVATYCFQVMLLVQRPEPDYVVVVLAVYVFVCKRQI